MCHVYHLQGLSLVVWSCVAYSLLFPGAVLKVTFLHTYGKSGLAGEFLYTISFSLYNAMTRLPFLGQYLPPSCC